MLKKFLGRLKEFMDSYIPVPSQMKIRFPQYMHLVMADLALDWKEIPGPQNNPRIVEAFEICGYPRLPDEVAWCGVYAGSRLKIAGYKVPPKPAWARNFLRAETYGIRLDAPEYGCIVVIERGSRGGSSHVGFVVGFTDRHVKIAGGNQENSVTDRLVVPRSKVLGFIRPLKNV